ncbi:TonB-dependent receptor plug domain-containing protein, partial [Novosphingobium sp. AP12]|uniref:TonB-dependent receptor plug domain-containing protein n=1 Tax=Novosphingobium sp. AP12 TaxID=1144305 RepID=UPI0002721A83
MSLTSRLAGGLLITSALVSPAMAFAQVDPAPSTVSSGAESPSAESVPADAAQEEEQVDISVPGGGNEIVVTGSRNRNVVRSSAQVVSVLTTEEIARTGEGNIAGALGRVTGLSVVGSGYVYVRGLGDRYSLALLNGSPLPSP